MPVSDTVSDLQVNDSAILEQSDTGPYRIRGPHSNECVFINTTHTLERKAESR